MKKTEIFKHTMWSVTGRMSHTFSQIVKYQDKTFRYVYNSENGTQNCKIQLLTDNGWTVIADKYIIGYINVLVYVNENNDEHMKQFFENQVHMDVYLRQLYGEF
jgi:hypothetical protein